MRIKTSQNPSRCLKGITLGKEIENVFSKIGLHLQTEINQTVGQMVIDNPEKK